MRPKDARPKATQPGILYARRHKPLHEFGNSKSSCGAAKLKLSFITSGPLNTGEPFLQDSQIERRVHRCISAQVEDLGCSVLEINGMPDHVHLVVKIPATVTIAQIAKKTKGVSSTFARTKLFDGDAFDYQEGYAALSVSPNQVEKVRQYVRNQKQHHADGTTLMKWEETDESV